MEAAAAILFQLIAKFGPKLYEYIKAELDGGADAEELRNAEVSVSIAFGGKEGKVVVTQREVEDMMADPSAD